MNWQLLLPEYPTEQPEWVLEDIKLMFYKCVRWQFEETMDPISCPYHYFCDSTYPGNYSPVVDILLLIFTTFSYFATLFIMVMDITGKGQTSITMLKRFFLPSGPISLPLILLALANGHRINTLFPLSLVGPAILQLVHISALSFESGTGKDIKYVFFEASTISGILHASLYLDSVVLPYYTGFDALNMSTFSGECPSCVCRNESLIVGGKIVSYRGWSLTTFLVVGALCLRIIFRVCGETKGNILLVRTFLEGLAWILIAVDCIYLTINSPPERVILKASLFGGIFLLICLHGLKKVCSHIKRLV
ncbi:uncharacterized protein LOC115704968 [Cannabis sativa]|uniref:Uncharacterized protein n=1 Tax=Cannabis sativa TaxID=3483 RepID=A0A7J6F6W6_CANSA|nr:uncharacterized protein LOC115704968 [Cannabis sativa]KAF4366453.1 hypothetical protein F8388_003691 [Cannabis sativa]KAF4382907.1 hypothetical protein G4B88_010078 [Cannabis sativa]